MLKELEFMLDKHPEVVKSEPPHIVVRFTRKMKLNYENPIEKQFVRYQFEGWEILKSKFPGLKMVPHYDAFSTQKINEWVRKAIATDETYKPGNFFNYFRIEFGDAKKLVEIKKEVDSWTNIVENAYLYVPAPLPFVNAANDPRAVNQGYLDVAPGGIDARYAWTFVGGDGAGIRWVDIERGWTLNHEDISAQGVTLIHGNILDADRGHGTSVLGEVSAVDNTIGCVGIAPHVAGIMASSFSGSTQANAIMAAIDALAFGDVLLLEAQNWVPEISMMLGPIELTDNVFEAIRLATALGIIVVEAGGNGTNNGAAPAFNLDTYVNAAGNAIFNPAASTFRDSGAIIVTAATSAAPHTRLVYGPFGRRIDCYAWGQNINTLDSSSAGAINLYRTNFGGTSGASPMITGAALVLQGIAEANLGHRFSPRQMRAILSNPATGTAPAVTETTLINVMPNLRLIIDNLLNIIPDIYIRDFVGDIGNPHSGAISSSPDIIVRSAPEANPQLAFGEGSGTENNAALSSTVVGGSNHTVYARVRNKGGAVATGMRAQVYWSQVASLVTPNLWNLIGTSSAFNVPNGDQLTVSPGITWVSGNIPGPGHYCFVGLIDHPLDPAPPLASFMDFDNFTSFIRNNNNVTWRNFNVVPPAPSPGADPAGFVALPFLLVGAPDKARAFDVEIEGRLPEKSKLLFEFPLDLYKQLSKCVQIIKLDKKSGTALAYLNPYSSTIMKGLKLMAAYQKRCRILVSIPKQFHKQNYFLRLKQFYRNEQVGGITWRIGEKSE